MRLCIRLGIWLSLLLPILSPLEAQQAQPSSSSSSFLDDVSTVALGTGRVLTSPIRWRGKDWAIFGSVIAGTVLISTIDEDVNDYFVRHQNKTADKFADFGTELGEPRTVVVLTGSLYVISLIADDTWLRDTCVILAASLLPNGGIQTTSKIVAGRARPHVGLGHLEFDPFSNSEKYHSFFSGHTMTAVAMAHVFARRIDNHLVKLACYGLGGIGAWARLYDSSHWLSDVVLGAALPIFTIESIANWYEDRKYGKNKNETKVGMQLRVIPTPRALHLSVSW
ncbi:MAG: phosphatase PAP2 family protein [Anaerolineae bacterium]|nr:phosphatase PAP2 family protein [Anaerolineae bacterium]